MKIALDEHHYIETYLNGYALYDKRLARVSKRKNGCDDERRNAIGYFGTVPQALERYLRIKTDEKSVFKSIKEYVEEYKRNYEAVMQILPKFKENNNEN